MRDLGTVTRAELERVVIVSPHLDDAALVLDEVEPHRFRVADRTALHPGRVADPAAVPVDPDRRRKEAAVGLRRRRGSFVVH